METSAAMETPTGMGTGAEAFPATRRECPRVASMIEPAERTGMHAVRRAAMSSARTTVMTQ
jgi:hypothetical protein